MATAIKDRTGINTAGREASVSALYAAPSYAAAEIATTMVQQGQYGLRAGWRAVAAAQEPLALAGYDFMHSVLSAVSEVAHIYRSADDQIAGDLLALSATYGRLGRALPDSHHAWLELARRSVERMGARQSQLLRSGSLAELATAQRDLWQDCVHTSFVASTTFLQLTLRITQDAIRPLQQHTQESLR
jgi:hypothetical protein